MGSRLRIRGTTLVTGGLDQDETVHRLSCNTSFAAAVATAFLFVTKLFTDEHPAWTEVLAKPLPSRA
jgi:hypothetical protein